MTSGGALTGWEGRVEPWQPGAEPRPGLLRAWRAGRAPFVRVRGVEVLRISDALSADVIAVLRERGIPRGPVLVNIPRGCVEVLVPLGSAAAWMTRPHAKCVESALMRCPALDVTHASGLWVAGRTWETPPGASPVTTSVDALAEALFVAVARHAARHDGPGGKPGPIKEVRYR
ncbi:hypothetical protein [Streptomyces fulvoviolaceus]|uniref:hypothetical protein n=1 Tax=Streptomyces fulvoviolaceus TaxID=285535 RepID=UPI0004C9FEE4|nr:hypothetical protein [Streptomyces fulvoviolaceus]